MTKSKCCGAYIGRDQAGVDYCSKCDRRSGIHGEPTDAKPEVTDEEFEVPDHLGRWICDYVWRDGEEYPPIKAESLRQVVDYILKLESEAAEHTRWIFTNALKTADLISQREEAAAREMAELIWEDVGEDGVESHVDIWLEQWKQRKSQGAKDE